MYFVYIIQSKKDNSRYTGVTASLKERMEYHSLGKVKSTANKLPYRLIWFCGFPEKQKAYFFEKYLKTGSGIAFSKKHLI